MSEYFTRHDKQNTAYDKEVGLYADICGHCKSYKNFIGNSKTTDAHECCHGIASELRMRSQIGEQAWNDFEPAILNMDNIVFDKYKEILDIRPYYASPLLALEATGQSNWPEILWNPTNNYKAGRINGFYLGENRAIILQEPNLRKSSAIAHIPSKLRGSRYNLYIRGQTAWDDTPLYIFDEYVAYIMGCATAVDLAERKLPVATNQDHCYGPIEFIIYGTALGIAIENGDKDYWSREPKFIPFYKWFLRYAFNTFHKARKLFPWGDADKMFNMLQTGIEGKELRDFLKARFQFEVPSDVVNIEKLGRDKFKLI